MAAILLWSLQTRSCARCEQGCGYKGISGFEVDEALAAKSGQMKRRSSLESWIVQEVNEDKTGVYYRFYRDTYSRQEHNLL